MENLTITEDKEVFKIYKIKSQDEKTFYGITTLSLNMCLNLLRSYVKHRPNDKKPYYELLQNNSMGAIVEKFPTREEAKNRLQELIKEDENCVNILKDDNKTLKEKKVKPRKTDDINYGKKYYAENKEKLKKHYLKNKEKLKEINRQKYQQIKEKLKRLEELEGKNK